MVKVETVLPAALARDIVPAIERAHTGRVGNGKMFVIPVVQAAKVRSGEREGSAL